MIWQEKKGRYSIRRVAKERREKGEYVKIAYVAALDNKYRHSTLTKQWTR